MRTLLLAACLFGLSAFAVAQKKFHGYYVALNGDTVAGNFPRFKQWKNNPSVVQFETYDRQLIELTPNNCKSFTVTGFDTYDVLETRRMTNRTSFKDDGHFTTETEDETYENIKAFLLKVYEADTVCLYEFSDKIRNNYFLKTPAGFFELLFKVDYKNHLSITDNRFIWQLRNFFANELNENKKLESKLNNLKYSQSDLVSFFNSVYSSGISVSNRPPGELVFMGGYPTTILK